MTDVIEAIRAHAAEYGIDPRLVEPTLRGAGRQRAREGQVRLLARHSQSGQEVETLGAELQRRPDREDVAAVDLPAVVEREEGAGALHEEIVLAVIGVSIDEVLELLG